MDEVTADQAIEQSVEDRIADKFLGDEPEVQEAEGSEEVESQEEVAEVEYEGARYQVPKALEKAILQEADYTRKTQEVANQRKALEQSQSTVSLAMMEQEFHQSVAGEVHNLKVLDNYIEALKGRDFTGMNAEEGMQHWMTIQRAQDERSKLSNQIESKHGEFKDRFQSQLNEAKAKAHDALSKSISGYTPESFKKAREYGLKKGFSEQVLDSIEAQPAAAEMVYKSMLYDQLQANKTSSVKRLDAPVVKPGSSKPMPQEVKNKLAFRKAMNAATTSQQKAKLIEQHMAQ